MRTNDSNGRKALIEFRRRESAKSPRPRIPGRGILLLVISLAACGFLTWWLWSRFRIRFYFFFIPFIGVGGPLLRGWRRRKGPFSNDIRESHPPEDNDAAGRDLEDGGRLIEGRKDEAQRQKGEERER